MRKVKAALAAATAIVAISASPAMADSPTYVGEGWKIANNYGVYAVSPTQQFTITFATQAMKDRYTPYVTTMVSQLNQAGVHVSIGGVETPNYAGCPPKGHVQWNEWYRPTGNPGESQGMPCYNTADHSLWGGYVLIDTEWWDGSWYLTPYKKKNLLVHEPMHAFGLDHPNLDLDGDGVVEKFECVKDPIGTTPVMCSPNGGYQTYDTSGKLTQYDLNGVAALLNNASILGIN